MVRDIIEKISAINEGGSPSSDDVLDLMRAYRNSDEANGDILLDEVREKVSAILDTESIFELDGTYVTPDLLMAIMLSRSAEEVNVTSIHDIVDEDGGSYQLTTLDVILSNGEIANIAVVE